MIRASRDGNFSRSLSGKDLVIPGIFGICLDGEEMKDYDLGEGRPLRSDRFEVFLGLTAVETRACMVYPSTIEEGVSGHQSSEVGQHSGRAGRRGLAGVKPPPV